MIPKKIELTDLINLEFHTQMMSGEEIECVTIYSVGEEVTLTLYELQETMNHMKTFVFMNFAELPTKNKL